MFWLVGNRGMLGSDVETLLVEKNKPFVSSDQDVDIADEGAIKRFTRGKEIEWVINCAAYTDVDRAERERNRAFSVNSRGACNLAAEARRLGAKIVHISTDYVFDGTKEGAYTEEDTPNPLGVYGKSKLEGENSIRETIEEFYILRTSWLYGKHGSNFVNTTLRLLDEKDTVRVVSDQWGSPAYTKDLAKVILHLIAVDNKNYGTYHFSGEGKTNWYEFSKEIYSVAKDFRILRKDVTVVPIPTSEYKTDAKRPTNSYLSKEKIKSVLKIDVPLWQESLRSYFSEINGI
jgi:dTDP-4-dehydrorhamnose reductase